MYNTFMYLRPLWFNRIQHAWSRRSIVWLSGVRRVGKTTLAQMMNTTENVYRNCDLPSVVRELGDPELFLESQAKDAVLVLDEIHQLPDPSRVLKIAADEYPDQKVLAIGSSTLEAIKKFRDSLTGRKHSVHLCPVLWEECNGVFDIADFDHRLLHGGLPEALLQKEKDPDFYSEWFASYYARDIAQLFQLRNRTGFLMLFRLLLQQSGGQLDYTKLSKEVGLSRPTVISYVEALCVSHALHLVFPFHGGGRREIVSRPKCYAFDTGFVTWEKGWDSIRDSDRGILWEHLVLDSFRFKYPTTRILYWRDKSGREIDFVIARNEQEIDVFECKMNPDSMSFDSLRTFRSIYPHGTNFLVSPFIKESYRFSREKMVIHVEPLETVGNLST